MMLRPKSENVSPPVVSDSLQHYGLQPTRSSVHADEPMERRVQGALKGQVSKCWVLAGIPQHLRAQVPLPAVPRGKGRKPGAGEAWGPPCPGCWLGSVHVCPLHQGAISERLTFPCPFCEAAFTSKTQLEKHRIWNHMDRPLPAPKPGPVSRPVTVSRPVGVSKPIGTVGISLKDVVSRQSDMR